ncbi:hypothetical protein CCR90_07045 [Rhodovulum sulfidophilum]|uniref:STAS-like domain-containing protein n=1 Tax=Rhodovulum sulfidophilum TaxID=35806 RepID=UPI001911E66F|nr:DUF4325 domain-containing protein [Rhodovulum sulfidophilum]MBK5923541.1 hypothetical protein [Rhodovulum sulfidophilum]
MVIFVNGVVPSCDTAQQGYAVFKVLSNALSHSDKPIRVDFAHIPNVTSSFVNTAFIPLLDALPFDEIKRRVVVVGANRQIANMLRTRMSAHSQRKAVAA